MLKLLSPSRISIKLFHKSIVSISQPFAFKEQDFISDSETDQEQKTYITKFEMYQHFQEAKTIDEVIKAFNSNNLTYQHIHFAAFQLTQIIPQKTDDKQVEKFIEDNIISNLEQLTPEQIITILQLFLKIQSKYYSAQIKKYIDANLSQFKHLQLPYIFAFYTKQGWKTYHIGKLLKQHLYTQQFTAHSLCQIIRGCYVDYMITKQTYHSDLAFNTSKQLNQMIENLNFHAKVALFNQLSKLRLNQTTSFKKFPAILYSLHQEFVQNFSKISVYSKLKLLEAYADIPDQFPRDLYSKLGDSLLSDSLTSSNQLKLYLAYKSQISSYQLPDQKLKEILNKVSWHDVNNDGLLLKFVESDFSKQMRPQVEICFQILKNSQYLSERQKIDLIRAMVKQNKIEDVLEIASNTPESLTRLIDQVYYSHKWIKRASSEEQKQNIQSSVEKLMEKLEQLDSKGQLSICHYILKLEPYENDPFYDFLNRKINFEFLQGKDFEHFLLRLNSQNIYNDQIRKKIEGLRPTLDQLNNIISNIHNIDYLNERMVRSIGLWILEKAEKTLIDESFDLNFFITMFMKLTDNCPIYLLHNMRGTIAQPIRDLMTLLAKETHAFSEQININVNQFIRFHQYISQLNFRTTLLNNIVVNLSQYAINFDQHDKFQLALLITQLDINQFYQVNSIKQFLNHSLSIESDTFFAQLCKTRILLYQLKNQAKLGQVADEVQLGMMIDQMKNSIISFDPSKQSKDHYLDSLMTLLDYDGWRISNMEIVEDGLSDFIYLYFKNIDDHINMKNMRPGLKVVVKTLNAYDTKFQFIRKYEKLFLSMFKKCKTIRNSERPHIQACLDYIEFAKKLKISDKETVDFLIQQILDQIDNLKQIQIVDTIQKLSEQKLLLPLLYDKLSDLIIKKILFYSNNELMDTLSALSKVGYFNENLFQVIIDQVSTKFTNLRNNVSSVQYLWALLVSSYYYTSSSNYNNKDSYQKILTLLMQDTMQFASMKFNYNMPIVFRQFMDIYNLLEYSLHLDLNLNQKQQQFSKKIVDIGKNSVINNIIPNQKLNRQLKSLLQFLENNQLEYKINYFFDNQYVDCYIPSRNQVIQLDNSLYVAQDMEFYTGFHYFNKWIMEGLSKKYEVTVIRVQAWSWMQMDEGQKKKILLM